MGALWTSTSQHLQLCKSQLQPGRMRDTNSRFSVCHGTYAAKHGHFESNIKSCETCEMNFDRSDISLDFFSWTLQNHHKLLRNKTNGVGRWTSCELLRPQPRWEFLHFSSLWRSMHVDILKTFADVWLLRSLSLSRLGVWMHSYCLTWLWWPAWFARAPLSCSGRPSPWAALQSVAQLKWRIKVENPKFGQIQTEGFSIMLKTMKENI